MDVCHTLYVHHTHSRMGETWEKDIRATEVNAKYEGVVENILRDKANHWAYDYYRDTTTGYDLPLAFGNSTIRLHKNRIKAYEAALLKVTTALDASKKDVKDPAYKKLSWKEADALELEYIELYKQKCEQMVLLDGVENECREFEWKQYLQAKRISLIQLIRNRFMADGDEDYMKRAITWIEDYISTLREKMK